MATIEKGEAFIVKRGREWNPSPMINLFSFGPPVEVSDKPVYDRSYHGMVFRAMEVCGSHVAAHWIGGEKPFRDGKSIVFDTEEVELWPVTDDFCRALGVEVEASNPPVAITTV